MALLRLSLLTCLAGELLRPTLLDCFDAVALVVRIATSEVAVRQELVDDMTTCVVEFLEVAHVALFRGE